MTELLLQFTIQELIMSVLSDFTCMHNLSLIRYREKLAPYDKKHGLIRVILSRGTSK